MPRSVECRLICIDPAQVHQFWPHVSPFIRSAMYCGRISDFVGIECAVHAGRALTWIVWNGSQIKAAVVTELSTANGDRYCTIVACGGEQRDQWLPLIGELESYAKREGCKAMRIYGRRGWQRVLPDYKPARVILEKELN
jgi:hypothetical protein